MLVFLFFFVIDFLILASVYTHASFFYFLASAFCIKDTTESRNIMVRLFRFQLLVIFSMFLTVTRE